MKQMRWKSLLYLLVAVLMLFSGFYFGNGPVFAAKSATSQLSLTQRNSIAMLNYLTVLTQEINASKGSRLYLEEVYSNLINNISPNAVDSNTLEQLTGTLDILEDYRMILVKRDRLKYVYEQNCAKAIKALMPEPLNILSIVESRKLPTIAFTILNLAIDSAVSYTSFTEELNIQYLQDRWELDDEESSVLHDSRKNAFAYMVIMVNEQNLPGELALNETYVNEFVVIKNNSNVSQQIQFLESNQKTYQAFGDYWLILAECYYKQGDYQKTLDAISTYLEMDTKIFRKDFGLARVLPLAIAAAKQDEKNVNYVGLADEYGKMILENTNNDDWALRYFVAQAYVDLFSKTNEKAYLQKAYSIILNNVNYLVDNQKEMNSKYLMDLVFTPVPKDATKNVKIDVDNYNRLLKEERKKAIPPVYEPLLLNCDLLFMLAEDLQIADAEKIKIDSILHENGESIFLNPVVDAKYWFFPKDSGGGIAPQVAYKAKELSISAELITGETVIQAQVKNPDAEEPVVIEDWVLDRVERNDKNNLNSFMAIFYSSAAEKYEYQEGAVVTISLLPDDGIDTEKFDFTFTAKQNKKEWWEAVKLWEDAFTFERIDQ